MHGGAQGTIMLLVVVLLVVLWFVGMITKATLGGLLQIVLVVAIVLGLVNFIGRPVRQMGIEDR